MWPFVGRTDEMQRLAVAASAALPGGVLLHGHAGVGKTRLLDEFVDHARVHGWAVERIAANPSTADVPMGALGTLIPDPAPTPPGTTLRQQVEAKLVERHGRGPWMMAVDDVPSLDPASASVLAQLTDRGHGFFVGSARSEELWPASIAGLVKDQIVSTIEVKPLNDDAIAELISAALGGFIDPVSSLRIRNVVHGNPLFLREVIEHNIETGDLRLEDGQWRLSGDPSMSPTLQRVVTDRLGRLTSAEIDVLELLAVAHPLELELLTQLCEVHVIGELERRHVLTITTAGRRRWVTFAHPLLAEVVRGRASVAMRRTHAERLAAAVGRAGARRGTDSLRLGSWHLEGAKGVDGQMLATAASHANAAADHELAVRLAREAIKSGAGIDAKITLADSTSRMGSIGDAEDQFVAIDSALTDPDLIAHVAALRAENIGLRGGDVDGGIAVLQQARGRSSHTGQMLIDTQLALTLAYKPDISGALEAARRIAEDPDAPPPLVVASLSHIELMQLWRSQMDEARTTAARGLRIAEEAPGMDQDVLDRLAMGPLVADSWDGRLLKAIVGLRSHYAAATTPPISDYAGIWAMWLCHGLRISGAVRDAARIATEGTQLISRSDPTGVTGASIAFRACALAELGDVDGVARSVAQMAGLPPIPPPRRGWLRWVDARFAAVQGCTDQAAGLFEQATESAFADGIIQTAAWVLGDALRLAPTPRLCDMAVDLTRTTDTIFLAGLADYGEALRNGDPQRLAEVGDAFTGRDEYLLAVRAHQQAAEEYLKSDDPRRAARSATRAWEIASAYTQLPHALLKDTPQSLTRRETEVARLAGIGLTSKEIAQRLFISARTVDNHLGSVFSKLDVHDREELATVFGSPTRETSLSAP